MIRVYTKGCTGGGNQPGTVTREVQLRSVSSPYAHLWVAEQMSKAMPTARPLAAYGLVGTSLYIIGGGIGRGAGTEAEPLDINEYYNIETKKWATASPMPKAIMQAASAVVDSVIHVIGGTVDDATPLSSHYVYDTTTDTWTTGADLPTARRHVKAVAVDKKIYVIGGYSTGNTNNVDIYDTETDTWSAGAPMPTARHAHCLVAAGNFIYAMGGKQNEGAYVECYDIEKDSWTAKNCELSPEYGTACVGSDGKHIYVLEAGYGNTYLADYNLEKDSYTFIDYPFLSTEPYMVDYADELFIVSMEGNMYHFAQDNKHYNVKYQVVGKGTFQFDKEVKYADKAIGGDEQIIPANTPVEVPERHYGTIEFLEYDVSGSIKEEVKQDAVIIITGLK